MPGYVTRAERGWLAGLFDGEGTIGASQTGSGYGDLPQFRLSISGSDPRTMHKAKRIIECVLGRSLNFCRYSVHGYKMMRIDVTKKDEILLILNVIVKDLAGKREQANVLRDHLAWRRTQGPDKNGGFRGRWYSVPDHVIERDRACVKTLAVLKKSFLVCTDYTEPTGGGEEIVESPEESGSATNNDAE